MADPAALANPDKTASNPFALEDEANVAKVVSPYAREDADPAYNYPAPPVSPFTAGVRGTTAGLRAAGGGLLSMAGRGFGVRSLEERGQQITETAQADAAEGAMRTEDVSSLGGVADYTKYALGNLLPYAVITATLGLGGRALVGAATKKIAEKATREFVKNVGTVAGPFAFSLGTEAGSIFNEATETGVENPIARAAAGGVAAAALDTALPAFLVGKVFGEGARSAARGFGVRRALDNAGKTALTGGALEYGTETAQTAIERLAAGKTLEGAEATSELTNAGAMGLIGGKAAGAVAGAGMTPLSAPAAATDPFVQDTTAPTESAQPAGGVQSVAPSATTVAETATPLPDLKMVKSEFPEIDPVKLEPATLFGRIEEVKNRADELDTRIAALSSAPAKGRAKLAAKKELAAAQAERATLDQRLSNLNTIASLPEYQPKRGSIENGVLVAEAPRGSPSIVTPGKSPIEAVRGPKPGFMKSATELVEESKIKARAVAIEIPLHNTPRETVKAPDLKIEQEKFLERAGRVAESNVSALVEQGIVPAESRKSTRAVIYNSVRNALKAEDVDAAKEMIRAGIERAVSRKLLKQDVDGFVDKVFADLAGEQPVPVVSATPAAVAASPPARQDTPAAAAPVAGAAPSAAGDVGSKAAPVRLRDDVEGYREGGVWRVKQTDARGIVTWPQVTGPNTIAEYDAVATQSTPADVAPMAPVERPAILVLGKVGYAPKSAEPVAIRANQVGGYDLYHGGYQALDFNTAEPVSYPPEMTTPQILADVKARSKELFGSKQRFYEDKPKQFNSQAAVDTHLRQVVAETQAAFAGQGRVVLEALEYLLGPQKRLQIALRPVMAGEPAGYVSLQAEKDVIAVATNAKDPLSVAYHEGFHYIEERLLTSTERRVLSVGLAPGTRLFDQVVARAKQYDYENKTDIAAEIQAKPEEAHAYGFEMWKRGELDAKGMLAKVFAKIREFIERVKNMLGGMGFESVLDIYRAADAGAYRTRTAMDNATSDTMYSEGSTAFKAWFGDSKVVDKDGKPLVVYHGTADSFDEFDLNHPNRKDSGWLGTGVYLTTGREIAHAYSRTKGGRAEPNIMPLYARVTNPYYATQADKDGFMLVTANKGREAARALADKWAAQLKKQGHDGVILDYKKELVGAAHVSREIVVFDPAGVKSAIGNIGTYDPANPNILFSKAAVLDMAQLMTDGQLKPQQLYAETSKFLEGVGLPKPTFNQVMGIGRESITGSVKRWYLENIASGTFIARDSKGFGNVFGVLTGHKQRKDFLIAQGVDDMLSKWDSRRGASQADIEAVGNALFKRTEGSFATGSAEYQQLIVPLTSTQRDMFEQANAMIADRLQQEFAADQRAMASLLGVDSPQYAKWLLNRGTKVKQLIEQGYVPERRYGDHVVHVTVTVKDQAGNPKPLTLVREQFETEAEARARLLQYNSAFEGDPAFVPAYEYKYAAKYDGSLSYQQFLDMARRQGIQLTQGERERMARAMVSSDSVRNNRIFRRSNVPGYSKDIYRVLSEFAVTMANKIAYSEFSDAINSAAQGNEVSTIVKQGQPTIDIQRDTDLWAQDGEMAGFYRNLADERIDFVMQRDPGGDWSRNARAAASMYFLGGSISAGLVNMSSLPMLTVPYLSAHTGYTNALGKTLAALKTVSGSFNVLRDIARLKDLGNAVEEVDSVPGLRQALIEAAQDGTVLDTEIYHIMGTTRGGMLSKSPRVQRAMDTWMAPFRMAEQANRFSTFIAAYRIGLENNLQGNDLYNFAQKTVYDTQFRYDEANRPALAHDPIWAILFTFKSFPIFMSELVVTLFRHNPRAGVVMLLSLTAAAGVNGLPFADDLMDLVDTIAQRIFGSPFNSKRAIRNVLKSASEAVVGADMSGLVMNGLVNEMTGLSFASRIGLGNLIPGTRAFTADADYKRTVEEVVGPAASMVGGIAQGAIDLAKGKPIEALREAAPLAVQNVMKSVDQFSKGYATDKLGRKLIDVSSWEAFVQAAGFSSANLARAYELDRIDRQTQAFYKEVQKDFSHAIVKAVQAGDREKINEAYQAVVRWNTKYPDMPMVINGPSLRKQIAEAGMPINERTLKLLPRALRSQSLALEAYGR